MTGSDWDNPAPTAGGGLERTCVKTALQPQVDKGEATEASDFGPPIRPRLARLPQGSACPHIPRGLPLNDNTTANPFQSLTPKGHSVRSQLADKKRPKLVIGIEDVQLCVANADRLLSDAAHVSSPTAVALTELALEEVLKGWVLYAHRSDRAHDAPQRARAIPKEIEAYIEDNFPLIQQIHPRSVFESHWKKLDALTFTAGLLKMTLKHLTPRQIAEGADQTAGGGVSHGALVTPVAIAEIRKLLSVVDESNARKLSGLKERGFYVNLTSRDQMVSPQAILLLDPKVLALYVALIIGGLRGIITATTLAES